MNRSKSVDYACLKEIRLMDETLDKEEKRQQSQKQGKSSD